MLLVLAATTALAQVVGAPPSVGVTVTSAPSKYIDMPVVELCTAATWCQLPSKKVGVVDSGPWQSANAVVGPPSGRTPVWYSFENCSWYVVGVPPSELPAFFLSLMR